MVLLHQCRLGLDCYMPTVENERAGQHACPLSSPGHGYAAMLPRGRGIYPWVVSRGPDKATWSFTAEIGGVTPSGQIRAAHAGVRG